VRIDARVPEPGRDQSLEVLGEHVLEHFGLVVDTIPRHSELLCQEQLEQAVVAEHLERHPPAPGGQPHPAVGLVLEQAEVGQLAHHRGDRSRGHPKPFGELGRRNGAAFAGLQGVHGLGVILHRG
jgi:hypothetical protein